MGGERERNKKRRVVQPIRKELVYFLFGTRLSSLCVDPRPT